MSKLDREAIAKAFGWPSWDRVVEDSRRDGYLEAGGRGSLASAIASSAALAENLLELVSRNDGDHDVAELPAPPPDWDRMTPRAAWEALKACPMVVNVWERRPRDSRSHLRRAHHGGEVAQVLDRMSTGEGWRWRAFVKGEEIIGHEGTESEAKARADAALRNYGSALLIDEDPDATMVTATDPDATLVPS